MWANLLNIFFFMWIDLLNRFWIITVWVNRFFYNVFVEHIFLEVEQIFFIKIKNKNRLLMFQIKSTKPIKPNQSNRIAIGWKTDPNQYALVLIIAEPIPISSVTNWKKKRANQTAYTLTFCSILAPLHPMLIRTIIIKFSYPKFLLFKKKKINTSLFKCMIIKIFVFVVILSY